MAEGDEAIRAASRLSALAPINQLFRASGGPAAVGAGGLLAVALRELRNRRVLTAAHDLVGKLRWRGGTGPDPDEGFAMRRTTYWGHRNDFTAWLRDDGPVPTDAGVMNCWEHLMYAAHRAGVVGKTWLTEIHADAMDAAQSAVAAGLPAERVRDAYQITLADRICPPPRTLYLIDSVRGVGAPDIPAGHVVLMTGHEFAIEHVMLSTGERDTRLGQGVLSHWQFPDRTPPGEIDQNSTYGVVQATTVEDVLWSATAAGALHIKGIEFGSPAWLLP